MHLIRKNSMCTANKGKHHVSVSHVGKLEGKEVKTIERWKKELHLPESRTLLFSQNCFFEFCVCLCIRPIQTSQKFSAAYWKPAKDQTGIQLQRKVKFLKITFFMLKRTLQNSSWKYFMLCHL